MWCGYQTRISRRILRTSLPSIGPSPWKLWSSVLLASPSPHSVSLTVCVCLTNRIAQKSERTTNKVWRIGERKFGYGVLFPSRFACFLPSSIHLSNQVRHQGVRVRNGDGSSIFPALDRFHHLLDCKPPPPFLFHPLPTISLNSSHDNLLSDTTMTTVTMGFVCKPKSCHPLPCMFEIKLNVGLVLYWFFVTWNHHSRSSRK